MRRIAGTIFILNIRRVFCLLFVSPEIYWEPHHRLQWSWAKLNPLHWSPLRFWKESLKSIWLWLNSFYLKPANACKFVKFTALSEDLWWRRVAHWTHWALLPSHQLLWWYCHKLPTPLIIPTISLLPSGKLIQVKLMISWVYYMFFQILKEMGMNFPRILWF